MLGSELEPLRECLATGMALLPNELHEERLQSQFSSEQRTEEVKLQEPVVEEEKENLWQQRDIPNAIHQ